MPLAQVAGPPEGGIVRPGPKPASTEAAASLAPRSEPRLLTGLQRGIARKCPACGVGKLFRGYLAVEETCCACRNDNEQYPSDDFAPYVTIFLVLHLMVPILFAIDRGWEMAVWLEVALAIPIFLAATLALLPFAKGGVIGFAWAYGVTRRQSEDENSQPEDGNG